MGKTFWARLLNSFILEPHFESGAGCWLGWAGWRGWAGLAGRAGLGWGLSRAGLGLGGAGGWAVGCAGLSGLGLGAGLWAGLGGAGRAAGLAGCWAVLGWAVWVGNLET